MIQDPRKVYGDYNVHYIFGLLKKMDTFSLDPLEENSHEISLWIVINVIKTESSWECDN